MKFFIYVITSFLLCITFQTQANYSLDRFDFYLLQAQEHIDSWNLNQAKSKSIQYINLVFPFKCWWEKLIGSVYEAQSNNDLSQVYYTLDTVCRYFNDGKIQEAFDAIPKDYVWQDDIVNFYYYYLQRILATWDTHHNNIKKAFDREYIQSLEKNKTLYESQYPILYTLFLILDAQDRNDIKKFNQLHKLIKNKDFLYKPFLVFQELIFSRKNDVKLYESILSYDDIYIVDKSRWIRITLYSEIYFFLSEMYFQKWEIDMSIKNFISGYKLSPDENKLYSSFLIQLDKIINFWPYEEPFLLSFWEEYTNFIKSYLNIISVLNSAQKIDQDNFNKIQSDYVYILDFYNKKNSVIESTYSSVSFWSSRLEPMLYKMIYISSKDATLIYTDVLILKILENSKLFSWVNFNKALDSKVFLSRWWNFISGQNWIYVDGKEIPFEVYKNFSMKNVVKWDLAEYFDNVKTYYNSSYAWWVIQNADKSANTIEKTKQTKRSTLFLYWFGIFITICLIFIVFFIRIKD